MTRDEIAEALDRAGVAPDSVRKCDGRIYVKRFGQMLPLTWAAIVAEALAREGVQARVEPGDRWQCWPHGRPGHRGAVAVVREGSRDSEMGWDGLREG